MRKKKRKTKKWQNQPGELWSLVDDTEDYYVSNYGRFRRGDSLRKITIDKEGYCVVNIGHGKKRLHRLVAKAFCPNPNNYPVVDHKDAVKTNCKASNLEWVSIKENTRRAAEMGLLSTMDNRMALAIDKDDNAFLFKNQAECADNLGLNTRSVYKVTSGKQGTVSGYKILKITEFEDRRDYRKKKGEENE